jgi:hypothetical protein
MSEEGALRSNLQNKLARKVRPKAEWSFDGHVRVSSEDSMTGLGVFLGVSFAVENG